MGAAIQQASFSGSSLAASSVRDSLTG